MGISRELDKTEWLTQEHNSNLLASGRENVFGHNTICRKRHQRGRKVEGLFSVFHFTYPITKRSILKLHENTNVSLKLIWHENLKFLPFIQNKISLSPSSPPYINVYSVSHSHSVINVLPLYYSQHWEQCLASVAVQEIILNSNIQRKVL